jgi:hypothetical protein
MIPIRSRTYLAVLLSIAAPITANAQAASQTKHPAVSLSAGAFQYNLPGSPGAFRIFLAGVGTTPLVAGRVELPLSRFVLAEGGLAVARPEQQYTSSTVSLDPDPQFVARTTFLISELQLQVQAPLAAGRLAPYLGLGAGIANDRQPSKYGGSKSNSTVSGSMGLRYWLSDRLGLRAELRTRGVGSSSGGTTHEWTLGTAWRL